MTRLRLRVMVPGFVLALIGAGLTLGPAIEAGSGRGDPTIGATFLVTMTVIAGLAWGLYRALATLLQPRWIAEIAERYGIPAGELMITMAPYREERITLAGPPARSPTSPSASSSPRCWSHPSWSACEAAERRGRHAAI